MQPAVAVRRRQFHQKWRLPNKVRLSVFLWINYTPLTRRIDCETIFGISLQHTNYSCETQLSHRNLKHNGISFHWSGIISDLPSSFLGFLCYMIFQVSEWLTVAVDERKTFEDLCNCCLITFLCFILSFKSFVGCGPNNKKVFWPLCYLRQGNKRFRKIKLSVQTSSSW